MIYLLGPETSHDDDRELGFKQVQVALLKAQHNRYPQHQRPNRRYCWEAGKLLLNFCAELPASIAACMHWCLYFRFYRVVYYVHACIIVQRLARVYWIYTTSILQSRFLHWTFIHLIHQVISGTAKGLAACELLTFWLSWFQSYRDETSISTSDCKVAQPYKFFCTNVHHGTETKWWLDDSMPWSLWCNKYIHWMAIKHWWIWSLWQLCIQSIVSTELDKAMNVPFVQAKILQQ